MLGVNSPKNNSSQKKKKEKVSLDSFEIFKPKSIAQAVVEQVKPQDNWAKDWLGIQDKQSSQKHVEMTPGVSYNPKKEQADIPKEAINEYNREIIHTGENQVRKEDSESSQKIQMLIQELQKLAKSVAQIEKSMILQAIDPSAGKKTGKYYENFFEWMLIVVQDARRRVEDSGAWLQQMKGKQKAGIHKMMKTNMKVAMSGERTNANNTG